MKCNGVHSYGRGFNASAKLVAEALQDVSIGRECNGSYETWDLLNKIFELQDRIEALEKLRKTADV
jgi:hypothetical protein